MTRRISPSHDWKMAHCGTGNNSSLNYFLNSHQID
ncbi:TPA: altronate dehydratase [Escherichia coli]|nr:altronate dehydratase [Escherichia coli]RWV67910.1 altronate dehydratase [Escherichia coli]HAJ1753323.1 altronate dehydratase [Escherichia coli]HAJ3236163.1 altronate dehydratase [Escherichia coli]